MKYNKSLIVPLLPIAIEKMKVTEKTIYHSIINLEKEDYTAKHLEEALISLSEGTEGRGGAYSDMPISIVDVATLMLILKLKWTQIVKKQAIPYHL